MNRESKARLNIYISLLGQAVVLVCGLIVPRFFLGAFGSEANGAIASISQFLSYITLLEGGIGGVARASLYKPLAEKNYVTVSKVICEIKRFFKAIGTVFFVYVIILSFSFHSIANVTCFDSLTTFLLVLIISLSTFAQYFIGISYSVLIQADQKTYITQIINSTAIIANAVLTVILIKWGCGILVVKLISSIVFATRPFLTWVYVKKKYGLTDVSDNHTKYLKDKWTGLGQHLAFFVHNNTDIFVLTLLDNLKSVSIYSVYNMVIANVQNIVASFSTGMEAYFGDMIAKKEWKLFNEKFSVYETLISIISCILFGVTMIMIVPFVKLYTNNINDANYIQPAFAFLLIGALLFYCWMLPYNKTVLAAGHFRQTQWGPYGEAIINIVLSVILVWKFGLVGVAIGTLAATIYCYIYYAVYLVKNICKRSILLLEKRLIVNIINLLAIVFPCLLSLQKVSINNYFIWILCSFFVTVYAIGITFLINFMIYNKYTKMAGRLLLKK